MLGGLGGFHFEYLTLGHDRFQEMCTQTDAKFDVRAGNGRPSQGANMKNIRHRFRPGGLHFLVLIIELFWMQGFYLPIGRSATFWSLQSVQSTRFGISRACAADLEAPTDPIGSVGSQVLPTLPRSPFSVRYTQSVDYSFYLAVY